MNNRIFIKVRFLSVTDTKNNRIKLIQSNINKSIIFDMSKTDLSVIDYVSQLLLKCDCINDVSILVDNTQHSEYLILVQEHDNNFSFPDIITELKDIRTQIK